MKGTLASQQTIIDRRALISGRLADPNRVIAPPGGEIASILVQARPERLVAVEAAVLALPGCEIHGRDPKGKLVVVVDAPDAGVIGTTLNTIALLPDVYSASLVFHAIDAG
jgi:periplasmic nitrate reductase NapD